MMAVSERIRPAALLSSQMYLFCEDVLITRSYQTWLLHQLLSALGEVEINE
jgi:hypothetical protein